MLDVTRNRQWNLWIEDDFDEIPYQIEINWTIWTRLYLTAVNNTTKDGKFIPYECINILWHKHNLDDVYKSVLWKEKSLREILISNKML